MVKKLLTDSLTIIGLFYKHAFELGHARDHFWHGNGANHFVMAEVYPKATAPLKISGM
jgi:hypothetical protein